MELHKVKGYGIRSLKVNELEHVDCNKLHTWILSAICNKLGEFIFTFGDPSAFSNIYIVIHPVVVAETLITLPLGRDASIIDNDGVVHIMNMKVITNTKLSTKGEFIIYAPKY